MWIILAVSLHILIFAGYQSFRDRVFDYRAAIGPYLIIFSLNLHFFNIDYSLFSEAKFPMCIWAAAAFES